MSTTEKQFDQAVAECRDIFLKKLNDYGGAWRIMRPESVTDQIFIKAKRIRSIETKGVTLVNEGIRPELIGIINYAIIGLIQLELGYSDTDDLSKEQIKNLYEKNIACEEKEAYILCEKIEKTYTREDLLTPEDE